eukprot:scaffold13129_cov81-Phaeocystis_antarctica.AAC.2
MADCFGRGAVLDGGGCGGEARWQGGGLLSSAAASRVAVAETREPSTRHARLAAWKASLATKGVRGAWVHGHAGLGAASKPARQHGAGYIMWRVVHGASHGASQGASHGARHMLLLHTVHGKAAPNLGAAGCGPSRPARAFQPAAVLSPSCSE